MKKSLHNPHHQAKLPQTILYLEYNAGLSLVGNGWLDDDSWWEEIEDSSQEEKLLQKLNQIIENHES